MDRLTGGETAAQMRDIIIASLESSKLFVLTENQEKADAILRGAAEDLVYTEQHSTSDGANTHLNVAIPRSGYGSRSGSAGIGIRRQRIGAFAPSGGTKRWPRCG